MKARKSLPATAKSAVLIGTIFSLMSINAAAQSSARLDPGVPLPATLLPEMKVTASASNPHLAPSWSLASTRPVPVTLMPTLTVTADTDALATVTLPTVSVYASLEQAPDARQIVLAAAVIPANVTFQLAR